MFNLNFPYVLFKQISAPNVPKQIPTEMKRPAGCMLMHSVAMSEKGVESYQECFFQNGTERRHLFPSFN